MRRLDALVSVIATVKDQCKVLAQSRSAEAIDDQHDAQQPAKVTRSDSKQRLSTSSAVSTRSRRKSDDTDFEHNQPGRASSEKETHNDDDDNPEHEDADDGVAADDDEDDDFRAESRANGAKSKGTSNDTNKRSTQTAVR
jgi:hypothetical protein